jgi:hypothetical protein
MNSAAHSRFELFAQEFVRKYWETVKSGAFPMPPNEPIEETVEELLSGVSHQTELKPASARGGPSYVLRMMGTYGSWWLFTFRDSGRARELVGASAPSDNQTPHELLGPVYSQYFEPFLRHVTKAANDTLVSASETKGIPRATAGVVAVVCSALGCLGWLLVVVWLRTPDQGEQLARFFEALANVLKLSVIGGVSVLLSLIGLGLGRKTARKGHRSLALTSISLAVLGLVIALVMVVIWLPGALRVLNG